MANGTTGSDSNAERDTADPQATVAVPDDGVQDDLERLLSDLKSPELYSLRNFFNLC